MVSVPGCNLLDLFFITLQFTVCVWSKGTKKWLQHRIDPKQQHTIACERQTFLLAHRRWGTFREKELNLQNVPQWRWARRRWARRNSTRKTSLNGDERVETSAVRRLQHTHDIAPLRSKAYNLQVKLVLFSNNLRSLCKYIIHSSPKWVRRIKVNIIPCLALKKAFRPLGTVLGPLS